jgi:hypothetical protein
LGNEYKKSLYHTQLKVMPQYTNELKHLVQWLSWKEKKKVPHHRFCIWGSSDRAMKSRYKISKKTEAFGTVDVVERRCHLIAFKFVEQTDRGR